MSYKRFDKSLWEAKYIEMLNQELRFHNTYTTTKVTRAQRFKWFIRKAFVKLTPFVIISRKKLEEIKWENM